MAKKHKKHSSKYYRLKFSGGTLDRPAQPPNTRGKRKRRRITDGLIALSSAVVLSVYTIGYLHTYDPAGQIVASVAAQKESAPATRAAGQQAQGPPAGQAVGYRDGTYVGRGRSRHGDIEATVVVQDGKISSASVSACMTRYSCRYMNPLVREVLETQDAPVDHISGATDSSRAYTDAIQAALAQAA